MGAEEVEQALKTAYALYRDRTKWIPLNERITILNKAADIVESRIEELTLQVTQLLCLRSLCAVNFKCCCDCLYSNFSFIGCP